MNGEGTIPAVVRIDAAGGFARARVIEDAPCGRCRGAGMVEVDLDGVRRSARCRCRRPHDAAAAWNHAAVPASHVGATFDMPAHPADRSPAELARRQVAAWARDLGESDAGGLLLHGPPGTGKTWMAVAALHWLTFRRAWPRAARFVDLDRYIADLKASFDREGGRAVDTTLDALGRKPVLVLDDLNGGGSEFDRRIADDLITRRVAHAGITILTSNRTPTELGQAFSDRVASRLFGMCRVIAVQGPDRRRPALPPHPGVIQ